MQRGEKKCGIAIRSSAHNRGIPAGSRRQQQSSCRRRRQSKLPTTKLLEWLGERQQRAHAEIPGFASSTMRRDRSSLESLADDPERDMKWGHWSRAVSRDVPWSTAEIAALVNEGCRACTGYSALADAVRHSGMSSEGVRRAVESLAASSGGSAHGWQIRGPQRVGHRAQVAGAAGGRRVHVRAHLRGGEDLPGHKCVPHW